MKTNVPETKVVVIHNGEGVSDVLKDAIWKKLGKDVYIKGVNIGALQGETDFAKEPFVVFCPLKYAQRTQIEAPGNWASARFVVLTNGATVPLKEDTIEYAPSIDAWQK